MSEEISPTDPMPVEFPAPVWPPPADSPEIQGVFPFKFLYMRITGLVSDAREGELIFDKQGLIIRGKAAPVAEIATPVLVASFVFCHVIGLIIADTVMKYGFLRPIEWRIPWTDVKQIVFDAKKPRAGIVYEFPARNGKIRTFTLVSSIIPEQYEYFKAISQSALGPAADFGKIKSGTSVIVLVFLVALLVTIAALAVVASMTHGSG